MGNVYPPNNTKSKTIVILFWQEKNIIRDIIREKYILVPIQSF